MIVCIKLIKQAHHDFLLSILDFTTTLNSPTNKLLDEIMDFTKYPQYLPQQLKKIEILEQNNIETHTKETLTFSNYLKKSFEQESIHKKISDTELNTKIISGPAKGTLVSIIFKELNSDTQIFVKVDLKLSLAAKFLQPIIKKWYKRMVLVILYKINSNIMNEDRDNKK